MMFTSRGAGAGLRAGPAFLLPESMGGEDMRTARVFRRRPLSACEVCGAKLRDYGLSAGDACPRCGASLEASRLSREPYDPCPVDDIPHGRDRR